MGARVLPTRTGPSAGRFDRIYTEGLRSSGNWVRVIGFPTPSDALPALGFAVSRKVGCHARRNRLRRQLREAVRSRAALLRPDLDYVVSAGESAANAPFAVIVEDLGFALEKLHARWPSPLGPNGARAEETGRG